MPSQILMYSNGGGFANLTNAAAGFAGTAGSGGIASVEPQLQTEVPLAGSISSLYVRVLTNDSAVDQSVAVRINASSQAALTATVTAGQTGVFTATGSVNVAAGDLVSIGITSGAGAGGVIYSVFSIIYTSNTPETSVQVVTNRSGGAVTVTSASSAFMGLTGAIWSTPNAAPTSAAWILRTAASFTYLRTYVIANTLTTAGATVALYVDGADTALSAAITTAGAGSTGEFVNTATTVSVAAGSSISFRFSNPNTGNGASSYQAVMVQVQRNSKWSNIGVTQVAGAGLAITSRTATLFFPLGGGATTGMTTEGNIQATARKNFQVQNMQVNIPVNGAGTTIAFRQNSSNLITLVLSSGQVGIFLDSTQAKTVNSTDLVNWMMDCSTAGVTGGWTLAGVTAEMASVDTIPQRTLTGVGV